MRSTSLLLRRAILGAAATVSLTACYSYRTASLRELAPGDRIRIEATQGLRFGPTESGGRAPSCGARRLDGVYASRAASTIALQPLESVRGADSTLCETWRGSLVTVVADTGTIHTKRRQFSTKRTVGLVAGGLFAVLVYTAASAAAAITLMSY